MIFLFPRWDMSIPWRVTFIPLVLEADHCNTKLVLHVGSLLALVALGRKDKWGQVVKEDGIHVICYFIGQRKYISYKRWW